MLCFKRFPGGGRAWYGLSDSLDSTDKNSMPESFWTIRHYTYGIRMGVLVLAGIAGGAYFNDMYSGVMYGTAAAIVYGVFQVIQWFRKYRNPGR